MFFVKINFNAKVEVIIKIKTKNTDKLCTVFWTKTLSLWRILHKDIMNIANNLRKFRNKSNISQQEIADTLGIDRKTYISWESGTSDIKSQYIPELAKLFNVEISELFQEKNSNIVINQHNTNTDNKENSINGVVLLLTDKEVMNQLVSLIKERVEKK